MAKELISAYVLAKRLGVSPTIIYRRIKAGLIETEKIGKTSYIDYNKYSDLTFTEKAGNERQLAQQ